MLFIIGDLTLVVLVCVANIGSNVHECFDTLANSVQYVCLKGWVCGTPGTPLSFTTVFRRFKARENSDRVIFKDVHLVRK